MIDEMKIGMLEDLKVAWQNALADNTGVQVTRQRYANTLIEFANDLVAAAKVSTEFEKKYKMCEEERAALELAVQETDDEIADLKKQLKRLNEQLSDKRQGKAGK